MAACPPARDGASASLPSPPLPAGGVGASVALSGDLEEREAFGPVGLGATLRKSARRWRETVSLATLLFVSARNFESSGRSPLPGAVATTFPLGGGSGFGFWGGGGAERGFCAFIPGLGALCRWRCQSSAENERMDTCRRGDTSLSDGAANEKRPLWTSRRPPIACRAIERSRDKARASRRDARDRLFCRSALCVEDLNDCLAPAVRHLDRPLPRPWMNGHFAER